MQLLSIIQELEKCAAFERKNYIGQFLNKIGIDYYRQRYDSGENIIVQQTDKKPVVAVSSHFDVVPDSPGANDNASAVAVCLAILSRLKSHQFANFDVTVFFFDEEESGLKGSKAYVHEFGIGSIQALINLEMVGQGNQFALWSLDETFTGPVLRAFEEAVALQNGHSCRFDQIVTNTADHISFRKAGLTDAFTVTCVSDKDLAVAYHYYKAQEFNVDKQTLYDILQQAPLFQHYHKATDLSIHLSEDCLQMTVDSVWNALLLLDG